MYKVSKNEIFGSLGSLIEHGTHWINYIILTSISENNRYFTCLYQLWNKFISFDVKKKGNLKHVIGFVKKKMNLGGFKNECL
jgi:hypothetical protein